jgi:hypothetical protein
MRAGGLLVGFLVLVAGWLLWWTDAGPRPLPISRAVQAARSEDLAARPWTSATLKPLRVAAELRSGDPLVQTARDLGIPSPIFAVAAPYPPGLLCPQNLWCGGLLGMALGMHAERATLGALPVPPEGAWVSLYVGDVRLATRHVLPLEAAARFVFPVEFLIQRVLLGGAVT